MSAIPRVSVIVCTYNREKYLSQNLESLKNQKADSSLYEIVIINNKSTDRTNDIATQFVADNPQLNCKYHIESQQGLTQARNRGIKESEGEYLAFIDDDAFARPEYIQSIIQFFEEYKTPDAAGGRIIPQYEAGDEPKWMSPYLLTLVAALDMGDEVKEFRPQKFPIGANMIFKAKVFEEIGLFDINLGRRGDKLEAGEEKDLIFRLRSRGGKIFYAPNIIVDHIIPESRVSKDYIRKQGLGIGISEKRRVSKLGTKAILGKIAEEIFKTGATLVLFFYYSIKGQFSKGITLIMFRNWVLNGLLHD
ncbi:MAG TPA: glycosyltransferase family 2 protein [Flavobacteriales bacterium]|jgi:glycosyltransferase involved in cell wall biosynthesis|nr:glycosyltransferase family 2 protein [Flavobacteriales bacterium]